MINMLEDLVNGDFATSRLARIKERESQVRALIRECGADTVGKSTERMPPHESTKRAPWLHGYLHALSDVIRLLSQEAI